MAQNIQRLVAVGIPFDVLAGVFVDDAAMIYARVAKAHAMVTFWVVAVLTTVCPNVGYQPCWRPLGEETYPDKEACMPARDRARSVTTWVLELPEHKWRTAQCRPRDHLQDYLDRGQSLWLQDELNQ